MDGPDLSRGAAGRPKPHPGEARPRPWSCRPAPVVGGPGRGGDGAWGRAPHARQGAPNRLTIRYPGVRCPPEGRNTPGASGRSRNETARAGVLRGPLGCGSPRHATALNQRRRCGEGGLGPRWASPDPLRPEPPRRGGGESRPTGRSGRAREDARTAQPAPGERLRSGRADVRPTPWPARRRRAPPRRRESSRGRGGGCSP